MHKDALKHSQNPEKYAQYAGLCKYLMEQHYQGLTGSSRIWTEMSVINVAKFITNSSHTHLDLMESPIYLFIVYKAKSIIQFLEIAFNRNMFLRNWLLVYFMEKIYYF